MNQSKIAIYRSKSFKGTAKSNGCLAQTLPTTDTDKSGTSTPTAALIENTTPDRLDNKFNSQSSENLPTCDRMKFRSVQKQNTQIPVCGNKQETNVPIYCPLRHKSQTVQNKYIKQYRKSNSQNINKSAIPNKNKNTGNYNKKQVKSQQVKPQVNGSLLCEATCDTLVDEFTTSSSAIPKSHSPTPHRSNLGTKIQPPNEANEPVAVLNKSLPSSKTTNAHLNGSHKSSLTNRSTDQFIPVTQSPEFDTPDNSNLRQTSQINKNGGNVAIVSEYTNPNNKSDNSSIVSEEQALVIDNSQSHHKTNADVNRTKSTNKQQSSIPTVFSGKQKKCDFIFNEYLSGNTRINNDDTNLGSVKTTDAVRHINESIENHFEHNGYRRVKPQENHNSSPNILRQSYVMGPNGKCESNKYAVHSKKPISSRNRLSYAEPTRMNPFYDRTVNSLIEMPSDTEFSIPSSDEYSLGNSTSPENASTQYDQKLSLIRQPMHSSNLPNCNSDFNPTRSFRNSNTAANSRYYSLEALNCQPQGFIENSIIDPENVLPVYTHINYSDLYNPHNNDFVSMNSGASEIIYPDINSSTLGGSYPHRKISAPAHVRRPNRYSLAPNYFSPIQSEHNYMPSLVESVDKKRYSINENMFEIRDPHCDITMRNKFHPDSYMASRPNIRSGFGGNYHRAPPESSLASTPNLPTSKTNYNSRSSTMSSELNSMQTYANTRNDYHTFNDNVNEQRHETLTIGQLDPPAVSWRVYNMREQQLDQKILKLIEQLPAGRRKLAGLTLVKMDIDSRVHQSQTNCNTMNDFVGGLEYRLREALQLVAPTSKDLNPAWAVKRYSDRLFDDQFESSDFQSPVTNLDDRCRENDIDDQLKSTDSKSDQKTSVSQESSNVNVITILRRLARCLAIRIADKRHELASVQQHVARNFIEEKLLRNRLGEISTDHYASTNSLSARLSADPSKCTISNRFDRWHINTTAVVQLLCQLARRLANNDAKLVNFDYECDHKQSDSVICTMTNGPTTNEIHSTSDSENEDYLERLKLFEQQKHLMTQILEAQSLKSELEQCRLRLLESIPISLSCDTAYTILNTLGRDFVEHFMNQSVSIPRISSKLHKPMSLSNMRLDGLDNMQMDNSGVNIKTEYLRDRVARHLNEFLKWFVLSQIYETEIKVDQDLWQNLQDELRLELS